MRFLGLGRRRAQGAEVSGELAVGDHVLRVDPEHGASLEVAGRGRRPRVRARSSRVMQVPPPGRELIGREDEVAQALESLAGGAPVELEGPAGTGKTALLHHLGRRAEAVPAGGATYLRAARRPLEDLMASVFAAFYEVDRPYLPPPEEVRTRLQALAALVLVDDLEASPEDAGVLVDALAACRIALAAPTRRLAEGARVLEVSGLPEPAALALLQRELGRLLESDEHEPARAVCRRVRGSPLGVVQAAAAVRAGESSLAALAENPVLTAGSDAEGQRALGALAPLAALGGATLSAAHLASIAELPDADELLERLRERELVEADGPGYSLRAAWPENIAERDHWALRALQHFAGWAPQAEPSRLLEDSDALLTSLRWGVGHQRWEEVLSLARALDAPLALGGRWGSWRLAAEAGLHAARGLGDRASEARALNQLGVRALGRGEGTVARGHLEEALRMREEIGDVEGTSLTRRNLDVLAAPPRGPGRVLRGRWTAALAVAGVALGGAAGVLLARGDFGKSSGETEAPTATRAPAGAPATTPRPEDTRTAPTPPPAAPPTAVPGPPRPDLVVTGARAEGGGGCTVRWKVRNRGTRRAPASTTTLRWQLPGGGSGQTAAAVPPLAPGAGYDQRKVSSRYGCGEFSSLTVRADADGRVKEADERNNQARARGSRRGGR